MVPCAWGYCSRSSCCREKCTTTLLRKTLEASTNATLACIFGREATGRKTELTWDELIKDNKKIGVDLTGLKA